MTSKQIRIKLKRIYGVSTLLLFALYLQAQDVTGDWYGNLDVGGIQLALVFHIAKNDTGYTATMDSPDQGANGIPVSQTVFQHPNLSLEVTNLAIRYEGIWQEEKIEGTFRQAGRDFPLDLFRTPVEKKTLARPQEPTAPFPYYTEEVRFSNPDFGITLAGTLSLPDSTGSYPVAVLISGSGPQDRNEELLGHKPFLILSDFLTRNGIGVLRYDDRGVGESTGDYSEATSADLATDVRYAVDYLKTRRDVDHGKIGLIGHSEGGVIAPMVAAGSEDVAFLISLAGPGIRGDSILLMQQALISLAGGASEGAVDSMTQINSSIFEMVNRIADEEVLEKELSSFLLSSIESGQIVDVPEGITPESYTATMVRSYINPWMLFFMRTDPVEAWEKVQCPVLAINGEKDLQVPPQENLSAIGKALERSGNPDVTIREMPGLNHLFQESKTGSPEEYAKIEQTFAPDALNVILEWLQARF